jgi:hypothetical protein
MFLQCCITYFIGAHVVPKSWLSPDDLLDFDYNLVVIIAINIFNGSESKREE